MDELGVAIVHLHVYMYTYMYTNMYTYMYTHMYTYMYTYTHTHTHTLHCLVEKNGLALRMNCELPASGISLPPPSPCQVVLLCKRLQLNASQCHIALLSGVSELDIAYSLVVICLGLRM